MSTLIVFEPTIALLLIFVALLPIFGKFAETFSYTMVTFMIFAASGGIFSIAIQAPVTQWFVVTLSVALCATTWVYAKKSRLEFQRNWLISAGIFLSIVSASQILTRVLGLSSVAFTDGHTILNLALSLQRGNLEPLSGIQALKRGFALPAMESLGLEGEYFVGLMPLFFVAAMLASYALLKQLFPESKQQLLATFMLGALGLSTEAIARHIYLENTHSIAWLFLALLLGAFVQVSKDNLDAPMRIGLILVFSAVGFTRLDYVLFFLPALLYFGVVVAKQRSKFGFALVGANLGSLMLWTSLAVSDFPVFGTFGPVLILLFGLGIYWLSHLFVGSTRVSADIVLVRLFWLLLAVTSAPLLVFANLWPFLRNLVVNLFLGEGLWGVTVFFLLALWLFVGFSKRWKTGSAMHSQLIQIGLLMFMVYLNLKLVDAFASGSTRPGIVRIGFGDSLNRTLVTWLPYAAILLNRALDLFQPEGAKKKPKA